jgi:hypothetical protein
MWLVLLFAAFGQLDDPLPGPVGTIEGVVMNGTRDQRVGPGMQVVLRVEIDGQFVAVADCMTEADGSYRFNDIPVVAEVSYLPGANLGDVHYPGPRVRLTPDRPRAQVELKVFDEFAQPNPLVIRRHDVVIRSESGALRVSESLQIENPARGCYVGSSGFEQGSPVTLRLQIPPDFERATFRSEFFGRHFVWQDHALATRIPWPPGIRDLVFVYVIPNESARRVWLRRVDLPCHEMHITVYGSPPDEISCARFPDKEIHDDHVSFASYDQLPAGQMIELHLDGLPISLAVYLRIAAVLVLLGSITLGGVWYGRRHAN